MTKKISRHTSTQYAGNVDSARTAPENRVKNDDKNDTDTVETDVIGSEFKCRTWFLSLNNPSTEDETHLISGFKDLGCTKYQFQLERGEECGTLHWQGHVQFKNSIKRSTLLTLEEGTWQKATHPKRAFKNTGYGCKAETRVKGPFEFNCQKRLESVYTTLLPWQNIVKQELLKPWCRRTINWIYDPDGQGGKTEFGRHMAYYHEAAFLSSGSRSDYTCAINSILEARDLKIVIINYSRTKEDFVSYDAIEQIKDGAMFSTKFDSKGTIFDPPHILINANFEPDVSAVTKDRWNIRKLVNGELIPWEVVTKK